MKRPLPLSPLHPAPLLQLVQAADDLGQAQVPWPFTETGTPLKIIFRLKPENIVRIITGWPL